jgi:hypothetical protein
MIGAGASCRTVRERVDAMNEQRPLSRAVAAAAEARCIGSTAGLLVRRRVHLPKEQVGRWAHFADGTSARVYRETVVDGEDPTEPCALVVKFRLRFVRGRWHDAFRWESLLNTPLFVGFPGFVSKLWLAHDERNVYRGIYDWDGPDRAERYARSLWRVLELGCVPDSIQYVVLPNVRRDELLRAPEVIHATSPEATDARWRPVSVDGPGD